MRIRPSTLLSLVLFGPIVGHFVAARDLGDSALRKSLEDLDVGSYWHYNDWEGAKAAAQRERKPILALFR